MFVTLEEAKTHLRVTYDVEDADIVDKIQAASAAVYAHLDGAVTLIDSTGEVDIDNIPSQVRQATLHLVEVFFRDRGGATWPGVANYLPPSVVALLYPLRQPTAV